MYWQIENRKSTWSTKTPSTLGEKKMVNFGPQTNKVVYVHIHPWVKCPLGWPSKWTFSEDSISALRGWCALKFLYALEIAQDWIAHTRTGTGVPQKIDDENLKFGLKFSMCTSITSGLLEIFSPNFSSPLDELWSTNEKVVACILIHPNCSYSVSWRKSIRHVVLFGVILQLLLLREKFRLPKLTFQSDLRRRAASRRALPRWTVDCGKQLNKRLIKWVNVSAAV